MECSVVIETPKYSTDKFEIDLYGNLVWQGTYSLPFPANYGGVPETLAGDGDPVDVIVASKDPLERGAVAGARLVGVLYMIDRGEPDEKLVAVSVADPSLLFVEKVDDIPDLSCAGIEAFLRTIKADAGHDIEFNGWGDADAAVKLIEKAKERYLVRA